MQKKTISGKEIVLGTLQTTYRKTLVRFIIIYFACLCWDLASIDGLRSQWNVPRSQLLVCSWFEWMWLSTKKRDYPFWSPLFFTDIGQRCPFRTPVSLKMSGCSEWTIPKIGTKNTGCSEWKSNIWTTFVPNIGQTSLYSISDSDYPVICPDVRKSGDEKGQSL